MSKNKPVVIVGAGIAGLTAAAFCAKNNRPCILLEKSNRTGGLVQSIEKDGFVWDVGIRAFENAGILLPMLKSLDIDIEFIQNPVSIGIGDKWIDFTSKESLDSYQTLLIDNFPQEELSIKAIIKEIHRITILLDFIYSVDNPVFLDNLKSFSTLKKYLPWLLKYRKINKEISNLQIPVNEFLKQYTQNQSLIDMITQHFFTNTPTFFALSYFGMYPNYLYPKGGTQVLKDALTNYCKNHDVDIRLNNEVINLDVNKKRLYTNSSDIEYSNLIWAADQKVLIDKLDGFKQNSHRDTTESVLTYTIATEIKPDYFKEKIKSHGFYTQNIEGINSIGPYPINDPDKQITWLKQYLRKTTYEISIPSLRDEQLAPEGKCALIISSLFDYNIEDNFIKNHSQDLFKSIAEDEIKQVIDSLFPSAFSNKLFSTISTPKTIKQYTSNKNGAISGWSFNQVNRSFSDTLNAIYTPYKQLYVCGQWSFQPAGLPVSILTAKFCVDEILKQ